MTQEEMSSALLNEAKIALNDGIFFGTEGTGFMRMNVACPRATIEEAMRRLTAWVNSLSQVSV
ncbi:Cystathionine beta-lyase PatB [compost metagenome]